MGRAWKGTHCMCCRLVCSAGVVQVSEMSLLLLIAHPGAPHPQNTASRMESTCPPGSIHVSAATRGFLPDDAWEPTGGVEVGCAGPGHSGKPYALRAVAWPALVSRRVDTATPFATHTPRPWRHRPK